jgi:hypothetical protein
MLRLKGPFFVMMAAAVGAFGLSISFAHRDAGPSVAVSVSAAQADPSCYCPQVNCPDGRVSAQCWGSSCSCGSCTNPGGYGSGYVLIQNQCR